LKFIFILIFYFLYSVCHAQNPLIIEDFKDYNVESIGHRAYNSPAGDPLLHEIKLVFNEQGLPKFYYSDLITPVCETGECKLVAIKVCWDLTGSYLRYELPEDRILTKLEHEPFNAEDYDKLDKILQNKFWPLSDFDIDDLIVDSTKALVDSKIDAYSGATATFVSEEDNIKGALYTIYTLWKFVHDEALIQYLRRHSARLIDQNRLQLITLLQSNHAQYHRWAIDALESSNIEVDKAYTNVLLNLVHNADQFIAYDAIRLLDLSDIRVQKKLWVIYKEVPIEKKKDIAAGLGYEELNVDVIKDVVLYLKESAKVTERVMLITLLNKNKPLPENIEQTLNKI